MRAGALAPYERALRTGGPLGLVDSRHHLLYVDRWTGDVDGGDESVLRRCRGPVLGVGCGPGRLVAALTSRDTAAFGIDISPAAVRAARRRGSRALRHDLFDTAPSGPPGWDHAARWATVLLIDGNIGIGGNPSALLARVTGCSQRVARSSSRPPRRRRRPMRRPTSSCSMPGSSTAPVVTHGSSAGRSSGPPLSPGMRRRRDCTSPTGGPVMAGLFCV